MAQTEATKNRLDALAVVALAATSFAFTVGGFVISEHGARLDRNSARIALLGIDSAKLEEYNSAHELRATHWIQQIIDVTRLVHESERKLIRLETIPTARSDPFTGSDGRRLENMFKELQHIVKSLQAPRMDGKD